MTPKHCSVDGCDRIADRLGFCTRHYMRARRHGNPTCGRAYCGEGEAFFDEAIASQTDGCILWPFAINKKTGYAQTKLGGRQRTVHRAMCEAVHGDAPHDGIHAAHSCGTRRCVNPRHLSWKTPLENERDKEMHGTKMVNERNHMTKLSSDEVVAIRVLRGRMPAADIARIFMVSKSAISSIQKGRSRNAT